MTAWIGTRHCRIVVACYEVVVRTDPCLVLAVWMKMTGRAAEAPWSVCEEGRLVAKLDWEKANVQELVAMRGGERASLDLPRPQSLSYEGSTQPPPRSRPLLDVLTDLREDLVAKIEWGQTHYWHRSRIRKLEAKLEQIDDMVVAERAALLLASVEQSRRR